MTRLIPNTISAEDSETPHLLGHSSVAFTMTVYQHVMPGLQAQAASTFQAAVFGEG